MSVTRLLAFRYLKRRFSRGLLVVGSIALGVATLTSSRILNRTIQIAAQEGTTPLASGDLFISNGELGVELPLATRVRDAGIDGVTAVRPVLVERVILPELGGKYSALIGAELGGGPLTGDAGVTLTPTGEGPLLDLLAVQAALGANDPAKAVTAWQRMPGYPVLISEALQEARLAAGQKGKPLRLRYGSRMVETTPVAVPRHQAGIAAGGGGAELHRHRDRHRRTAVAAGRLTGPRGAGRGMGRPGRG